MQEFGGYGYDRRPGFRKSLAWLVGTVSEVLSLNTVTGQAQQAHIQAEHELLVERFGIELQSEDWNDKMLSADIDPDTYYRR